ncbi:MAG TPA: VWA domain-containing protein [Terracidiphilus sp.]|nr:VWA domain-containing protein [Terracidiphilus sp.]
MMRNLSYFCSVLVLACVPAGSAAQQAGGEAPAATLHVQAREVLLPVTVRDKHGALVTNLTKDDFTLSEDGRPQTIKSFAVESNLPFQIGLLVDTSRSLSGGLDAERKAANKFVDQMLPNNTKNQAFLIHFDREVELLRDFTSDAQKLHTEIDEMGPTSRSRDDRNGPETTGDDRDWSGGRRGGTQLYDAIYLAADDLMKPKDGRKALVVFSDGVDRGSKESMSEALDAADHANLSIYTIYFKGEQERGSGGGFPGGGHHGGMGGGWPGGGGGYPGGGYPGGGHHGGRSDEPSVDGKKIMQQIAERTGGRFFEAKKRENLDEIYAQIAEELHRQYLLTYTPDMVDNEGNYHKIALKAKKDDYTVLTRAGYYAPGGDEK